MIICHPSYLLIWVWACKRPVLANFDRQICDGVLRLDMHRHFYFLPASEGSSAHPWIGVKHQHPVTTLRNVSTKSCGRGCVNCMKLSVPKAKGMLLIRWSLAKVGLPRQVEPFNYFYGAATFRKACRDK